MTTPIVLITVPQPLRGTILTAEALARLRAFAQVTLNEDGRNWTGEEIRERLPGVEGLITGWGIVPLATEVLSRADRLRIIAHSAGSVKGFIGPAVYERGIVVTHAAARIADSVAEFTLLMALTGLRQPHELDREMKGGLWPRSQERDLFEIAGKRVGLLGMGYVGRKAARLFQAVGAEVWAYDPYLAPARARELGVCQAGLDELLTQCKVISVHLPITDETHHLLGARELALLPDGAVFINTARSWVVDQEAMVQEIGKGRFWAALDVFDVEPLSAEHPLREMPNVFLTPHTAGYTRDCYSSLMALIIEELERFFRGEPLKYPVTQDMLATMA
jgi:phosphoglycerate dehydrogenase-like enzyme